MKKYPYIKNHNELNIYINNLLNELKPKLKTEKGSRYYSKIQKQKTLMEMSHIH